MEENYDNRADQADADQVQVTKVLMTAVINSICHFFKEEEASGDIGSLKTQRRTHII